MYSRIFWNESLTTARTSKTRVPKTALAVPAADVAAMLLGIDIAHDWRACDGHARIPGGRAGLPGSAEPALRVNRLGRRA